MKVPCKTNKDNLRKIKVVIMNEPDVSTQNVPRLWKVDLEVIEKTTLECISYLIQLERDLSLFTKFLYSRYSIRDN